MSRFRRLWCVYPLLFFSGQAQLISPRMPFVLNVDYARFRHTDQQGYLEIYYGFYPGLITYEFKEGKFSGGTKIAASLTRKEDGQKILDDTFVIPAVLPDTSEASLHFTFVTQTGYSVPYGEYTLSVQASDSLAPSRKDTLNVAIHIAPYAATIGLSDIELCSNLKASDEKHDLFYKNSMVVVPNPTLVFGGMSSPVVYYYFEMYNIDPDSSYTLKTTIFGSGNEVIREFSKSRKYGVKNAVEVGTVNASAIASGRYRIALVVLNGSGNEIGRSTKTFFVFNPNIAPPLSSSTSVKASELAGLTAEELGEEFRKAQYVASDQEIRTFSSITSPDGRREFLARFWTQVEAGRLGRNPIKRSEYLDRVNVANNRYRNMGKEGWRTDRGRVFILYGEPDEVERHPNSQESRPYEVWHYFKIENGVDFIFVDRSAFGKYQLVHSTKRGELRDDDWQRYLK